MALERKDIRCKLDPELHEALTALCEIDHVDIGEFVEREIIRVILQRVHDAHDIAAKTQRLGKIGNRREDRGSAGKGKE